MAKVDYRYWMAVIFAGMLPVLAAMPAFHDGGAGALSYLLFDKACHQDSARSFWINGVPMAVCARCAGIYIGAFAGVILSPWLTEAISAHKKILLPFAAPIIMDVAVNIFITTPAPVRALTGLIAGAAVAAIVLPAFMQPLWRRGLLREGVHG